MKRKSNWSNEMLYDCYSKGMSFAQISRLSGIPQSSVSYIIRYIEYEAECIENDKSDGLYQFFKDCFANDESSYHRKCYHILVLRYGICNVDEILKLTERDVSRMHGISAETVNKVKKYAMSIKCETGQKEVC